MARPKHLLDVFSAHAEVVPGLMNILRIILSILRARGGSSFSDLKIVGDSVYSPRTRR